MTALAHAPLAEKPTHFFLEIAQRTLPGFLAHPAFADMGSEQRRGGFLCVARHDGTPRTTDSIGINNRSATVRNHKAAQKGAQCLGRHLDLRTSAECIPGYSGSRGAVRCQSGILSFACFFDDRDELFVIALAIHTGELMMEEALSILRDGNNLYRSVMQDLFP